MAVRLLVVPVGYCMGNEAVLDELFSDGGGVEKLPNACAERVLPGV